MMRSGETRFDATRSRWLNRVVIVVMAWAFACAASAADAALTAPTAMTLEDRTPSVEIWPMVTLLADPAKALNVEQVRARADEFKKPNTAYGTLGLRDDAVWLRFAIQVAADSDGQWVFNSDYPVINHLDVYLVANGKVIEVTKLGNLSAGAIRPNGSRTPAVLLRLMPSQTYELLVRVENTGAMILPMAMSKPPNFHAGALREQMIQGLLTGLALCLLIYSLANWITLREHLFVKYAILISGSLLFSLLQFGVGNQYVWPGSNWMELHMGGLSALIAATGSFLFIEHALRGPDTKPWFPVVMKTGAALTVASAVLFALDWIDIQQVTAIVSTLGLAPSLLGLPGAIGRARKGDSVGVYFLLAWAIYFVSTAILIEVIKGRVGANFWTLHSFQFGATLDMLLFMRVLGLRTKALQSEVQRAHRERDSFHSLAYTDALTGLANRRSLNASIDSTIGRASPTNILALYMMDLDGFKQVNDQFGHDVGDELLIAVAGRLKANLRTSDVVARLGGDEFLVMSSGLSNEQLAAELGEKLLSAFAEPFVLSKQTCHVGMTIGFAIAPHDGIDAASLLKRADAAMYAGKNSGKNCVRRDNGHGGTRV